MTQINKNEQGCLGPKECKYASSHHSSEKSMNSAYMWVKAIKRVKQESYLWKEKNVFLSQQARRGTNYELYINNGHVYETRRMLEQLWKLYFGMLLRSFPASPSFWRFFPFWKWRHQPGWVHQRMWRSWFHACWAQVRLCWTQIKIEILRDRQFCHCGNVEPPLEFVRGWDMCGTSCPPTPMSPPPELGFVENCGTSLHTMVSFHLL